MSTIFNWCPVKHDLAASISGVIPTLSTSSLPYPHFSSKSSTTSTRQCNAAVCKGVLPFLLRTFQASEYWLRKNSTMCMLSSLPAGDVKWGPAILIHQRIVSTCQYQLTDHFQTALSASKHQRCPVIHTGQDQISICTHCP
eukprot:scpid27270/ scgid2706/ 